MMHHEDAFAPGIFAGSSTFTEVRKRQIRMFAGASLPAELFSLHRCVIVRNDETE